MSSISLSKLVDKYGPNDYVKVGVEGGEHEMLAHNTDWADSVGCMNVEGHPPDSIDGCVDDSGTTFAPSRRRVVRPARRARPRSGSSVGATGRPESRKRSMPAVSIAPEIRLPSTSDQQRAERPRFERPLTVKAVGLASPRRHSGSCTRRVESQPGPRDRFVQSPTKRCGSLVICDDKHKGRATRRSLR